jgi:hypothetical protein
MPHDIQVKRSLTNTPSTLLFGQPGWSDSNQNFYIGTSTGVPFLINNVKVSSPSLGQVPIWNGTNYINSSLLTIGQNNYSIATSATNALDWLNYSATNVNANYPSIEFKRANGTIGAPTSAQLNGITGGLKFIAEDSFTAAPGFIHSEFYSICTENQTGTSSGSEFRFRVTPNGTKTLNDVFFIENDGTLSVRSQTNYELKVTSDTDIPNKKYVDSTNNLQATYNNSTSTEIVTNSTLGGLTLRRGSTADTDNVFTIQDGTGLSRFNITGEGTTIIEKNVSSPAVFIQPPTGITDPNITSRPARLFIESDRVDSIDGIRVFFNDSGNPDFSGYIKFSYNGSSPELTLLDMDDDPSYLTFSIARQNLSNPGTFTAPAIVSKFGSRGTFGAGLTGFSWLSNGGVSGAVLTEIMSCDSNFLSLPTRTTANRPLTPVNNMLAYNSTLNKVEAYENGIWTQYVDVNTNQTIAGNKIFTGRVQSTIDVQQYFNITSVTTTLNTFSVVTGMSITIASPIISTYNLYASLNIRHSTNTATVVEVQVFVNGVADPDTLINYSMSTNVVPVLIPIKKIYVNAAVGTVYDIRWRRVSGTATPSVTTKSLILQETL